jgi:hypothetical protein
MPRARLCTGLAVTPDPEKEIRDKAASSDSTPADSCRSELAKTFRWRESQRAPARKQVVGEMGEPHRKADWNQGESETTGQILPSETGLCPAHAEPAARACRYRLEQSADRRHIEGRHDRNHRTEFQPRVPAMHPHHYRLRHSGRIHKRAEYQNQHQGGDIRAPVQPSDSRATTVVAQALSGQHAQDADILLRTSLHAIEAKGAVEISQLPSAETSVVHILAAGRFRECNRACHKSRKPPVRAPSPAKATPMRERNETGQSGKRTCRSWRP